MQAIEWMLTRRVHLENIPCLEVRGFSARGGEATDLLYVPVDDPELVDQLDHIPPSWMCVRTVLWLRSRASDSSMTASWAESGAGDNDPSCVASALRHLGELCVGAFSATFRRMRSCSRADARAHARNGNDLRILD